MPQGTEGGLQPTHQPHNCNPTILNILIKMKNNGLSDYTIKFTDKALTYLNKHANLNNPEEVKQYIANHKTSNHYKRNLSIAYNKYAKHHGLTWKMPKCKQPTQLPNIPKNRQP